MTLMTLMTLTLMTLMTGFKPQKLLSDSVRPAEC